MKRFIGLFLVLMLLFSVSCSSAESEIFEEDFNAGKNSAEIDFDGYDYKIRFYDHYVPEDGDLFGYKQGTVFNDAVIKRINDIETEYNCTITATNSNSPHLEDHFVSMILSGVNYQDTVVSSSWRLRTIIASGVFEPLSKVSHILDYHDSEKWGSWKILEQGTWKGELYGVIPVQWPGVAISAGWMFVFNEEFAGRLGQPDPREYIEDGSWSREKLGEMMLTYTTEDLGYPLKALLAYEGHFYDTALRANNVQTYAIVDGEYVSGYHTPAGLEALTWADNFLHKDYVDCIRQPCPPDEQRNAVFIGGEVAMFLSHLTNVFGTYSEIPFNVESYCVLPMPNGPERAKVTSEYTTGFERVQSMTFFPLNGELEASARIADRLFEPLDGFGEEELKEYYMRNFYHDERDYELAKQIFENGRYTYLHGNIRQLTIEALYGSHSKSVAQILEESEDAQNEAVKKYVEPTASTMADVFGEDYLQDQ